jgi:hypothetical protein
LAAPHDPSAYNVTWDTLGSDFNDSMPIGNGDIGFNVWTEKTGDIVLLAGKTDAYSENGQLLKLGRIRIKLSPNPFLSATSFTQTLNVARGEIDIVASQPDRSIADVRIWVDANRPVAHVDEHWSAPVSMTASTEIWRTTFRTAVQGQSELDGQGALRELNNSPAPIVIDPDIILPSQNNAIDVCHFNARSTFPLVMSNQHLESLLGKYPDPLLHRAFGMLVNGPGLIPLTDQAISTRSPRKDILLNIYSVTMIAGSAQQWQKNMNQAAAGVDRTSLKSALAAHRKWWSNFWDRSWIDVSGDADALAVTQGYAIQRYMDACGGRGTIPIKYNGSIFTVGEEPPLGSLDYSKREHSSPDFRAWGGNFWAQNERQIYWPMIASGDYDLLSPYLSMYRGDLPLELDRTRLYWGHAGASYPETMYFWGTPNNNDFGWNNPSNIMINTWIRGHIVGGLETVAMMLTEYDYTQDQEFAARTLVPVASAVTAYYDQHWPRSEDGKIHMDPAQSIETYQQSVNPTPDIAGLMDVLPRLLALPTNFTAVSNRAMWTEMLADLPPIPLGTTGTDGKLADYGKGAPGGSQIILPAEKYSRPANVENPELYAIFPFRIFDLGQPDLELAKSTFDARRFVSSTCWGQDGEDAALLGMTDSAKSEVSANFKAYGWQKFKWFWKPGHDWTPDMDNGGAGMSILQLMLLQCQPGTKHILLLRAWPAVWNADFKLDAPYNTTIMGTVKAGKLTSLTVTPPSRRKDIVIGVPE